MPCRPFRQTIFAAALLAGTVATLHAQDPKTPPNSASAQPTLPGPMPTLTVPGAGHTKAKPAVKHRSARRSHRGTRFGGTSLIERPALANVELLAPIPHPPQPPHVTVPVPAYPLETFVTAFTTPPPPVVCRPARREPHAPDPHLLYERAVVCAADNP